MSAPKWIANSNPPVQPAPNYGIILRPDPDGVSTQVCLVDAAGVITPFQLFTTGPTGLMAIDRLNTSAAFITAAGIQNDGGLIAVIR